MESYVAGVSTRSVDDLVAALGIDSGISKSEVSRICAGLDEVVIAFRTRRLDHTTFPYVYLDATYLHVRNAASQVVSMAVVVATGITADGGREVLGLDVGDSEDEVFWRGFLTALRRRGLTGVRLVISDQHSGLVAALKRAFQRTGHQRCRVHFARNLLALVPKTHTDMVAAVFRTIFAQPDPKAVAATWDEVRGQLAGRFPKIGTLMDGAKAEVLAFTAFPRPHWPKIWSTNPLVTSSSAGSVHDVQHEALSGWDRRRGRGYLLHRPVRRRSGGTRARSTGVGTRLRSGVVDRPR